MDIYLDHAATSPLRPVAFEAMAKVLTSRHHGNPTGFHRPARAARQVIDDARDVVAAAFGADPSEVVFTSGGTESNNLAISGLADRGRVLCSAVEHHAVGDAVKAVDGLMTPVDGDGVVDVDGLSELVADNPDIGLVSVMLANNETGVVQPLHRVARAVLRHRPDALVHTDATQATAWLNVAAMTRFADLVTVSAHKFGGPVGIGALIVRNDVKLKPQLYGGGQERERRSGTHNVAGILGMAAALQEAIDQRDNEVARLSNLRDQLGASLGLPVTGSDVDRIPNILHVCQPGVDNESALIMLDEAGVSASGGASCSSGALQRSHVLAAMGVAAEVARGALRFSLGWSTTQTEIDHAAEVIPRVLERMSQHKFAEQSGRPS